ncbi:NRPS protein [Paecilomyces lecythidis]
MNILSQLIRWADSQLPAELKKTSPKTTVDDAETVAYWRQVLTNSDYAAYPTLPPSVNQPVADKLVEYQFPRPNEPSPDITISILARAAWAIIVSRLTDSDDVLFCATSSTNAPAVVCVKLTDSQKVREYLNAVRQQESYMVTPEKGGFDEATMPQTLLIVQSQKNVKQDDDKLHQFITYGLRIHLEVTGSRIDATAAFDQRVVEPWLAIKLLQRLEFVMQQLSDAISSAELKDIAILPPLDMQQIWEWNSEVPPVVERCIHEVILEHSSAQPDAPAVCAWDGNLTYSRLDALSNQLASQLIDLGIGPEKVVPLCSEKSMWTVVAWLAILKAGGAFVLLDPTLPEGRIRSICQQVNAVVGITSASCQSRLSPFTQHTVVLGKESLGSQNQPTLSQTRKVTPTNAAYIIFTSGSTGEPKGCVIEHQAYCSAAFGHGAVLGMSKDMRALQFGSYNFAGAIMEMLMTLIYGGCICIPSEEDRASNLAQVIGKLDANWAFLTSTVLSLLHPETAPSLKTICVGGEPIRSSQIREWAPKVHLRQTYGSAETAAVVASARLYASSAVTSVGKATTARCWLVDPVNVNQLVPVGSPGEVLFEGPVIGREYIGQPEKSSATFIDAPSWRSELGRRSKSSRFYRTGDLAAYRSDGSIELLGRKDTQVKLRGQRIELGEIEHQARLSSSDVKDVAVELTTLNNGINKGPQLIGFLVIREKHAKVNGGDLDNDEHTRTVMQSVRARLETVLPHYMIPSVFVPIQALPLTASGKTHRKKLREIGSAMSRKELELLRTRAQMRPPTTLVEKRLQEIWSQILKIDMATIGIDHSFFSLGGDSITAMKVVGEARKFGINLMVPDIFRQDTIAGLAHQQSLNAAQVSAESLEAVLVEPTVKQALLEEIGSLGTGIHSTDIADIYPLTSVQETLVVASVADGKPADYFYLDLDDNISLSMLESGCSRILQRYPILRTCFFQLQGKLWQAVLNQISPPVRVQEVSGDMDESLRDFCLNDGGSLSPTQPLAAFILLKNHARGMRLVLRMAHAQYDAFSTPVVFESLFNDHHGLETTPSFFKFMSYASSRRPQSIKYWAKLLQGSDLTVISPKLPPGNTQNPVPEPVLGEAQTGFLQRPDKITAATLVRTAWAVLLSRISGDSDIVYCQVVSGRNSGIPGVERIVGCCLNIVPTRVVLSSSPTVGELVCAVQEQLLEMGEADTLGFRDIVENCTNWPATTNFESMIHHRDIDQHPEIQTPTGVSRMHAFENHMMAPCIFVVSYGRDDKVRIELNANTHIMTTETAKSLADCLVRIIEKLVSSMDVPVQSLLNDVEVTI